MGKITVTLNPEDVAMLREVLHLALIQSEAVLDDAATLDELTDLLPAHNVGVSLMTRIDAMLPGSTGFFD